MPRPLRTSWIALAGGVLIGALSTAGALFAQGQGTRKSEPSPSPSPSPSPESAPVPPAGPFDIVDTPGSTFLLNRQTGQVWRLSFTTVGTNKYWYGMHIPIQQPGTFEDFQSRLRRELQGQE